MTRRLAKWLALRTPPLRRLIEERDSALAQAERLRRHSGELTVANASAGPVESHGTGYLVLPGTEYSRYAIPLEYLPSRNLKPRWGRDAPPIALLANWIAARDPEYASILRAMRERKQRLEAIPRSFQIGRCEPAWLGVPFSPFDLAALYTLIGEYRPKRYLEIGSGVSTAFARQSIRDHDLDTRIISIDPEPRAEIDSICDEVLRDGLENCDLTLFDVLQASDVVFLDGSHRVFMNSDVTVFMIDVLPRLKPGVVVHVHDIALPWDYPEMFINWYWSEAYILAAYFIAGRDRVRPVFPTAWVCRSPQFAAWFVTPLIDLGTNNDGWRGGGSMWFTHVS